MSVISSDVYGVYVRIDDERHDLPLSIVVGGSARSISVDDARVLANVLTAYAQFADVRRNVAKLQYDAGARRDSVRP